MGVFLDSTRRLRTAWRLPICMVGLIIVGVVVVSVVTAVVLLALSTEGNVEDVLSVLTDDKLTTSALTIGPTILVSFAWIVFCRKVLDRRSVRSMGYYRGYRGLWWSLGMGAALGAAPILLTAEALLLSGQMVVADISFSRGPAYLFLFFIPAALFEEICCRGYLLQNFLDIRRPVLGLFVTSTIFWLMHGLNYAVWSSPWPGTNLFLAGIILGLAYMVSGDIWFVTVMHATWNFAQGGLLSVPVSGTNVEGFLRLVPGAEASTVLTGGEFGFEGSVLSTVSQLAVVMVLLAMLRRNHRVFANDYRGASARSASLSHEPLTREEVISVIEGTGQSRRVPMQIHLWVHPGTFGKREPAVREILAQYPQDIQIVPFRMPQIYDAPRNSPEYRWVPFDAPQEADGVAIDSEIALADWSRLDELIEKFPTADYPDLFAKAPRPDGRYRVAHWWFCYFERHWSLRGMTNALTDYYTNPDEVHRLFRSLTDFYKGILARARREQYCDGVLTGDDLGTQVGPFFSLEFFREFYKPYYSELCRAANDLGMHFWLHSCGNVEPFIPDWLDGGLDVLHPVQKHAMDEKTVAERYGDRLTVFAGLDVQQVIPWGTPEEVRDEVRFLVDTYWRPGCGKCIITAGNGINQDCTLESLTAFFDESLAYGTEVCRGSS